MPRMFGVEQLQAATGRERSLCPKASWYTCLGDEAEACYPQDMVFGWGRVGS